jgi:hypothetical protein
VVDPVGFLRAHPFHRKSSSGRTVPHFLGSKSTTTRRVTIRSPFEKSIWAREALHAWESWTKDSNRRRPFAMLDVGLIFRMIHYWLD